MKHYLVSTCLLSIPCSLLVACGGSDLDPGAGDDPGGGTGTLLVEGRASAEPRIPNATGGADFDTELSVRISLNGQAVTTGIVTVTSNSGTAELAYQPDGDQIGRWTGILPNYDEVYVLDVESGPDLVEGVRVDGPNIHVFEEPIAGATVDSTLPLDLAWSTDGSDTAVLDAEEVDDIVIPDTGAYVMAVGMLKAENDQARENTIRLERTNRVVPSGGAPGSEWSVRIRNEVTVVAQPNPAL